MLSIGVLCFVLFSCNDPSDMSDNKKQETVSVSTQGELPEQTQALLDEEWNLYRTKHAELSEATARKHFKAIQLLSARARTNMAQDAEKAGTWALRRALARRWLKTRIEDVFSPESVDDKLIQEAIDAYAFESGHPTLVTASHILIMTDDGSTEEERLSIMTSVHARLAALSEVTDEALAEEAVKLIRMGYKVDVNTDLEFPRYPMQAFLGEQLPYRAVVEPFAAAAFSLDDAHPLSGVVKSEFGHHIILFKKRTEGKKAKLSDIRDYMVSRIVAQGRNIAASQFISEVEQQSTILYNEEKIKEAIARQ